MLALEGHTSAITALAFSPDGQLASASKDSTIRLWEGGMCWKTLFGHSGPVRSLAFSDDGYTLASGGVNRDAYLWSVRSGQIRQRFSIASTTSRYADPPTSVNGLAFFRDSSYIALALNRSMINPGNQPAEGQIEVWNLNGTRSNLVSSKGPINLVALNPNRILAWVDSDKYVWTWDISKSAPPRSLPVQRAGLALAASPDGRVVAFAADYTVQIWDAERRMLLNNFSGHKGRIDAIAFSPDGRLLLSGSWDKTVRLWDVQSGLQLQIYRWPLERITAIGFSPDGLTAVAGDSTGKMQLWDMEMTL